MAEHIEIPKLNTDDEMRWDRDVPGPGWFQSVARDASGELRPSKPLIKCKCGEVSGIGLHHVHADGRVTASYWHATTAELAAMGEGGKRFSPGCGWHVFLRLLDYSDGAFLPEK